MMAENGLFLEVGCKNKTLICFAVLQMYELFFFHVLFLEVTAHVLFLEVPGHVKPTSLYLVAGLETYELFVFSCSWMFEVAENALFLAV